MWLWQFVALSYNFISIVLTSTTWDFRDFCSTHSCNKDPLTIYNLLITLSRYQGHKNSGLSSPPPRISCSVSGGKSTVLQVVWEGHANGTGYGTRDMATGPKREGRRGWVLKDEYKSQEKKKTFRKEGRTRKVKIVRDA